MAPELTEFPGMLLAGVCRRTSIVKDRTSELWREFRSREGEIKNRVGDEAYSVRVYDDSYSFSQFDPAAEFDKWAGAEVNGPCDGFRTLEIPSGNYAVFVHTGTAAAAPLTFGYIFGEWLPRSGYILDGRPHFEVLPPGYNPFDAEAREEIWLPIKDRAKI